MCTLRVTIKNAYEILYSSLFSHVLASHGVNGDSDVKQCAADTTSVFYEKRLVTLICLADNTAHGRHQKYCQASLNECINLNKCKANRSITAWVGSKWNTTITDIHSSHGQQITKVLW